MPHFTKLNAANFFFFFFFFFFFKSGPCAPIYYAVLEHNPRATLLGTSVLHLTKESVTHTQGRCEGGARIYQSRGAFMLVTGRAPQTTAGNNIWWAT